MAGWLRSRGIDAVAYSSATDDALRPGIEQALLANEVKVVVATSALGMGFDKPDLAFVIHYQSPGSPIAYYQQVGRAGRALPESLGVLLRGVEDRDIQDYFIRAAFPPADLARQVVDLLEERAEAVRTGELLDEVNVRPSQLELLLKTLEVDGAIERDGSRWLRTLRPWTFDQARVESVTALRRVEQAQMDEYAAGATCRMAALRGYLDDAAGGQPCGRCDVCTGASLAVDLAPAAVEDAIRHLRSTDLVIERASSCPPVADTGRASNRDGRVLSVWGDGGSGGLCGKAGGRTAAGSTTGWCGRADLVAKRWQPTRSRRGWRRCPRSASPTLSRLRPPAGDGAGLPCEMSWCGCATPNPSSRSTTAPSSTATSGARRGAGDSRRADGARAPGRRPGRLSGRSPPSVKLLAAGSGRSWPWPWPTGPAPPGEVGGVPRHRPPRRPAARQGCLPLKASRFWALRDRWGGPHLLGRSSRS